MSAVRVCDIPSVTIVCRLCRVLERVGFDRFQGVEGRGWGVGCGFLWAVGFQEGVKDFIGKYGMVVIQMILGYLISMDVKRLDRAEMGSFLVMV